MDEGETRSQLARHYTLWYSGVVSHKSNLDNDNSNLANESPQDKYENLIKPLATFKSVEDFWAVYQHLKRPEAVETKT